MRQFHIIFLPIVQGGQRPAICSLMAFPVTSSAMSREFVLLLCLTAWTRVIGGDSIIGGGRGDEKGGSGVASGVTSDFASGVASDFASGGGTVSRRMSTEAESVSSANSYPSVPEGKKVDGESQKMSADLSTQSPSSSSSSSSGKNNNNNNANGNNNNNDKTDKNGKKTDVSGAKEETRGVRRRKKLRSDVGGGILGNSDIGRTLQDLFGFGPSTPQKNQRRNGSRRRGDGDGARWVRSGI